MPETVIAARGLSKRYRGESGGNVLDKVDLDVYEGEILGVHGSSGSGKTTLLSILGGLVPPTSGSLLLFDEDISRMGDRELSALRLRRIGFIFQEHNLLPALTVQENIELPLSLLGTGLAERMNRIQEVLEVIEMEHLRDRYPSQLSRGQRQRVAAVRAFINRPSIVLADEPVSDLDRENAGILMGYIKELNLDHGTTVIIAATDPDVYSGVSTRSLRLLEGRLV